MQPLMFSPLEPGVDRLRLRKQPLKKSRDEAALELAFLFHYEIDTHFSCASATWQSLIINAPFDERQFKGIEQKPKDF